MADKINEINSSKEIYDAEVPSSSTDRLIAKLKDLERQVSELRLDRSRSRSKNRTQSRPRSNSQRSFDPRGRHCYYHFRFGSNCLQNKCRSPCSLERVGKLQPADRVATSSSAGIQDCRNLRLFVTDKNTGLRFLVDSGADISIIPPKDKNRMPSSNYKLYAANGTEIVTYGTKVRNLDIRLRRQFQWPFVIANTNRAIIGADFLNNFGLIIDIKNKRLIDGITNLSIRGVIQSISDMGNISTLNSSSKVSAILTKYPNLCRPPSDFVEAKHSVKHYIPTIGQPIHSKARRLDSQRLTLANAEFQYMLNNGIIRPSNSPWASPLHLVSKKDESLRPCGDYRRLNAVKLPDRYPIPRLDDLHHILKGTRVYSKIDLCKAFYQIPIAEEDKPKTAIITPFGLFEFNVMSFGLRNATATFQRFMHEVLRNLDFAFVYLDDILVASKTEEEHYSHLETLFSRLNSYGLRSNLSKSKFLVQEIDFLGYLITSHGVKPLPTKVKAILEYKKPKTVHELRIFLGMLNFYRTFLNNAAETQAILHEYLRGAKKKDRSEIKWTEEAVVQFEQCKQALANTALLAYPDTELPISLSNGTEIVTYGTKVRNLDIGLRRQFQWPFVIANTNRAIIGADFLNNFGLIIDIKNKRLIDGITNLSIRGVIQSISDMGNISTLNSSSKVSAILTKYPNLCRPPSDFVEAKHSVKHYIPTIGQPIHSKARRLDSQRLTLANAEFQYMLNNGIIRPSNSPWASPLPLVSKKDESLRPCGDYRRLNAVTLPDRYPIPRLDDLHHILKGTRVYSKIDLCKAFYQIPIAEEDKPKTAIITPFGLFEFNVMSFGLRNATATFQRFMHEVLRNLDFAFVYLDDILVASKTEEEHYSHLETLFSRLNFYGLRSNLSKSKFLVQEIDFLGYLITSHGVKPLPTKVKTILEYKKPKTVHELRIFLGMLNFYRTFLNNAAETQAMLHEYLRGAKKKDRSEIKWTEEAVVQFEQCKQALANTALLAYPDTELPISLCTDASDRAVGSVLQQLDNNTWKPIEIFSKKLNPAQFADALSRVDAITTIDCEEIAKEQTGDSELQNLILKNTSLKFKQCPLQSGKLLWCDVSTNNIRPFIPIKFRMMVFRNFHELSHPGIKATTKQLTSRFIWPNMNKDIRKWAQACVNCQKCKVSIHTKSEIGKYQEVDERFSVIHIDLIGPLPPSNDNIYCLTCIDRTDRVKKPLEPPYEGPFPVLDRTDKYFTLKVKGRNVTISIDRLRPAYLLADSDNLTSEHPTAARPIVSGALPSTSSQQNPDPPDVEKYTEFQGTGSAPDLTRTISGRIIKKP
ncbi:hypothetical protein LAZ67_1001391, partial [Cordylochernes scorpioides]